MKTRTTYSSVAGPFIERFIALKQSLGRKFAVERDVLKHLDHFLYANQTDLAAKSFSTWCHSHQHHTPTVRRNWMRIARNLCLYRKRTEPACFVPDPSQFPACHEAIRPHIFSETEIVRLLKGVGHLENVERSPIRRENFRLALVLLYSTGLRRGELLRLTIGDYNRVERTLFIRESKFHKSRILPLSNDGRQEMEDYLRIRSGRGLPASSESPLLWNGYGDGGYYDPVPLGQCFRVLFGKARIQTLAGIAPRLHDFRHSFAVQALLRWYRQGDDVQAKLPLLSTYMGHVSIVSTQYYLQFMDGVIGAASDRFARQYSALVTPFNACGGI
jgi:integrase